ncbi:hypothetical protein [Pantoea cypripedii]|uniref:hypothetical protein n=1 Tax=Pantoea cypripedii TaxID=55209 RepID=UPI001ABF87F0|nr:hypothetical protein [Pantoea cypripedii]
MTTTVSLTSAEVVAIVNKNDDLKAAVVTKYLAENAPVLEITDIVADVATEQAATE